MPEQDFSGRSFLVRNVIVGWASQLMVIVTGFLLPRIIDEELGRATVGIWDLSWSLVAYMNVTNFDIASSLNRFVAKFRSEEDMEGLSSAVSTVTAIQLVITTVVLMLVAFGYHAIPGYFSSDLTTDEARTAQLTFLMLGLGLSTRFLFDSSRGVLTGSHRWDIYNGIVSVSEVITAILMITVIYAGYGLFAASTVYFVVTLIENLIRVTLTRRMFPEIKVSPEKVSRKFAADIFRFGLKSFALSTTPLIVLHTTNLMIASTLGPTALAVFARPNALIRFIQTFVTRFTFILTPMAAPILAREGEDRLREFAIDCTKFGLAFTFPTLAIFCVFGDEVIRLWMGEDYVNATVVRILGIGFLFSLAQSPILRILVGLDKHGRAAMISMIAAIAIMVPGGYYVQQLPNPTLEMFAGLVGSAMFISTGLLIPLYACRVLKLRVTKYLHQAFWPVIWIVTLPTICLQVLDQHVALKLIEIIFSSGLYLITIALGYWIWLLNAEQKARIVPAFLKAKTSDKTLEIQDESNTSAYSVELVKDWDAVEKLKYDWIRVLSKSNADPLINSWEFVHPWIAIWRHKLKPYVVVVKDSQGVICGIAPFYLSSSKLLGLLPVKTLRLFADFSSSSEYQDIIAHSDEAIAIKKEMFTFLHLQKGDWDCIFIRQLAEWKSASTNEAALQVSGLDKKVRHRKFSRVPLSGHSDAFKLSQNLRSNLRKTENRLKHQKVEFSRCESLDDLPVFLEDLFSLHKLRWNSIGKSGTFARNAGMKQFYTAFAEKALEQGWLRLFTLKLDGVVKASQIGYQVGGVFYSVQEGFDPDSTPGIGNILRQHVIELCIEQNIDEYDFMGGISAHKQRWGAVTRDGSDLMVMHGLLARLTLHKRSTWPGGKLFNLKSFSLD